LFLACLWGGNGCIEVAAEDGRKIDR
jgi:hypothetical protein